MSVHPETVQVTCFTTPAQVTAVNCEFIAVLERDPRPADHVLY